MCSADGGGAPLFGGEAQEQPKRVAVAGDRVGTGVPLPKQAFGEEVLQEGRKRKGDHGSSSGRGVITRSAASCNSSGTASRYQYVSAVCT